MIQRWAPAAVLIHVIQDVQAAGAQARGGAAPALTQTDLQGAIDGAIAFIRTPNSGLSQLFDSDSSGVCVTTGLCPSNTPTLCGSAAALCGKECICTSDCSTATAANLSVVQLTDPWGTSIEVSQGLKAVK